MRINGKNVASLTINGRSVATLELDGREAWSAKDPAAYNLNDGEIEAVYSRVLYTGEPVTAWIEVKDVFGDVLQEGRAYELEYADNVDVGTATVTARGIGRYYGQLTTQFDVVTNDVSDSAYEFELDPAVFPEDAPSFDVAVTGQDPTGEYMTEGQDFTVYNDQNGTVTITGVGRYTGTTTRTYSIIDTVNYLTFTSQQAASTIKLDRVGSWTEEDPQPAVLEYKTDSGRWQPYTLGQTLTLLDGRSVKFRGNNDTFGIGSSKYYTFTMTGSIAASGSVMTLVDQTDSLRTVRSFMFYQLFYECKSLTSAPELPATYVNEYCYSAMFRGCSSLTTAPELPATTLAGYCYNEMFGGCRGLTAAPELPATNLARGCYAYMFSDCRGLTAAPELPATTLARYCYNGLFNKCTSLNRISVRFTEWNPSDATLGWVGNVAATGTFTMRGLAVQYGTSFIPEGWTVEDQADYLKFTALENNSTIALNAVGSPAAVNLEYRTNHEDTWHEYTAGTTLSMFKDWEVEFRGNNTTLGSSTSNYYQFAMTGKIAAGGSVMTLLDKSGGLRTVPNYAFVNLFNGCASMTTAPKLPATTLGESCYRWMFKNCSSIGFAPELPATTLSGYCYYYMFEGCAALKFISVKFTQWHSNATSGWASNVSKMGVFECPAELPDQEDPSKRPRYWARMAGGSKIGAYAYFTPPDFTVTNDFTLFDSGFQAQGRTAAFKVTGVESFEYWFGGSSAYTHYAYEPDLVTVKLDNTGMGGVTNNAPVSEANGWRLARYENLDPSETYYLMFGRPDYAAYATYVAVSNEQLAAAGIPFNGKDLGNSQVTHDKYKEYTGQPLTINYTVKDCAGVTVPSQYISASYEDNVEMGTAKLTLTGLPPYSGSKQVEFQVIDTSRLVAVNVLDRVPLGLDLLKDDVIKIKASYRRATYGLVGTGNLTYWSPDMVWIHKHGSNDGQISFRHGGTIHQVPATAGDVHEFEISFNGRAVVDGVDYSVEPPENDFNRRDLCLGIAGGSDNQDFTVYWVEVVRDGQTLRRYTPAFSAAEASFGFTDGTSYYGHVKNTPVFE